MTTPLSPKVTLDTMLGYLGFVVDIEEVQTPAGLRLQVHTNEGERLTGAHGETLDHIQFLLNRILQNFSKDAPRVTVDVEHYRTIHEDMLVQRARQLAETVRTSGHPVHLDPMNSYQRHLIHEAFKDDPDIQSVSASDTARLKRITLKPRA